MKFVKFIFCLVLIANLVACTNDDDNTPQYTVPETYNFENVKYTGQTTRIRLLDSLGKLINKAKFVHVTKQQLVDIYQNTNGLFTTETDPAKFPKLSNKMAPGSETQLMAWFQLVEDHSPMAGDLSSKTWFITPEGLDVSQLVQKTLMGSVFYYTAITDYLEPIATDDNNTVTAGSGTAMEHHWDEAFGYYGAPIDFKIYTAADITQRYKDTNGNGKQDIPAEKYWFHANYSLTRDEISKNFSEADKTAFREGLMTAFLTGRAAISNKDYTARDEARTVIYSLWEKQIAASAMHYCNEVKANLTATSLDARDTKAHAWAEGRGFINALQYSPVKILPASEWNAISAAYGDSPADATEASLDDVIEKIRAAYNFTTFQAENL